MRIIRSQRVFAVNLGIPTTGSSRASPNIDVELAVVIIGGCFCQRRNVTSVRVLTALRTCILEAEILAKVREVDDLTLFKLARGGGKGERVVIRAGA